MSNTITDAFGAVAKFIILGILTAMTFIVLRGPTLHFPSTQTAPQRTAQHQSTLDELLAQDGLNVISPTAFEDELAMTPKELLDRWEPFIREASLKFGIPESWIRSVMSRESGGHIVTEGNVPITSSVGAMGLMQVMPATYEQMRKAYGLSANAYNPHDNIIAGAAYLDWLHGRYGYPAMFAAYNDGPGNYEQHLAGKRVLPAETVAYVAAVTGQKIAAGVGVSSSCAKLTGKRDRRSMIARLKMHCAAQGYRAISVLLKT